MRASWALLVFFLCLVLTVLCSFVVCLVGSGAGCSLVPCVLPPFWSSGVCPLVSLVLVPMRFGSLCPLASSMLVLLCSGSICPLLCPVLVLLRVGVVVDTWMFLLCSIVLFSFVLKDLCVALLTSPEFVLMCSDVLCLFLLFMVFCFPCRGCSTVVFWYVLGRFFVVCFPSRVVSLLSLEELLVVFVVFAWSLVVWSNVV